MELQKWEKPEPDSSHYLTKDTDNIWRVQLGVVAPAFG